LLKAGDTRLGKHIAHSGGRCCFASSSSTAAQVSPVSRCRDVRTAEAMQRSGARGATTRCRPLQKQGERRRARLLAGESESALRLQAPRTMATGKHLCGLSLT